jgi:hypothetical protein
MPDVFTYMGYLAAKTLGNKLTYMDPPPVSRDGRAATRKRADAGIYPASD